MQPLTQFRALQSEYYRKSLSIKYVIRAGQFYLHYNSIFFILVVAWLKMLTYDIYVMQKACVLCVFELRKRFLTPWISCAAKSIRQRVFIYTFEVIFIFVSWIINCAFFLCSLKVHSTFIFFFINAKNR